MNQLQAELATRTTPPTTIKRISEDLAKIGYKLDRTMDCKYHCRYMTGPRAGESYPAISTGMRHVEGKISAYHFAAPRDENFKTLQDLRYHGTLYAVVGGRIFEI